MNKSEFIALINTVKISGGTGFKLYLCDKEIILKWNDAQGRIQNVVVSRIVKSRPTENEKRRLNRFRIWLKVN